MFTRIRIVIVLALMGILIPSVPVLAKGGFSFIAITAPNLKEEIRSSDSALTEDFFAFADFYRDKTKAPADPGVGYEITRYYIQGKSEIAFDRLHYYPESGLVFYDGIAGGGSSEYDGEWYLARTEIKTSFEQLLSISSPGAADPLQASESLASAVPAHPRLSLPFPQLTMVLAAGTVILLLIAYRFRKAFAR